MAGWYSEARFAAMAMVQMEFNANAVQGFHLAFPSGHFVVKKSALRRAKEQFLEFFVRREPCNFNVSLTNKNQSSVNNNNTGAAMSKLDVTTQELFLRLGSTSRTRSAKADALFRRLRFDRQDQIKDALQRAPRRLDASDFSEVQPVAPAKAR